MYTYYINFHHITVCSETLQYETSGGSEGIKYQGSGHWVLKTNFTSLARPTGAFPLQAHSKVFAQLHPNPDHLVD